MVGIGAGIGAVVDFMVRDQRILYRARPPGESGTLEIQPMVSRRAQGAVISLRWLAAPPRSGRPAPRPYS